MSAISKCTKCGKQAPLWSVSTRGIEGLPEWIKAADGVGCALCLECLPADVRAKIERQKKEQ